MGILKALRQKELVHGYQALEGDKFGRRNLESAAKQWIDQKTTLYGTVTVKILITMMMMKRKAGIYG